ncbi:MULTISPECIES: hypothetical protein [unclassified Pseudomonas]|uniref:hypothetical protein n=1 Tax=unclassified Pseudomonas TaxID=196821 RepID=UPI001F5A4B68|nr:MULTISPECIES: hypothetical protein [unclassified Pseudomonas]
MEIWRQGSNRKTGWAVLKSKKAATASLAKDSKGDLYAALNVKKTSDPDRSGEYDHEIRLTIPEVVALLDALAAKGVDKYQAELMAGLAQSARSLNRLVAVASGIPIAQPE